MLLKNLFVSGLAVLATTTFGSVHSLKVPNLSIDPASLKEGISAQCLQTLVQVFFASDLSKCLPILDFLPLVPFIADPASLLKQTDVITQVETTFCSVKPCTDDVINTALATVEKACANEIKTVPIFSVGVGFFQMYSPIQKAMCATDGKSFCDVLLVNELAKLLVGFNPKDPKTLAPLITVSPFEICTDCNQAMILPFEQFLGTHPDSVKFLNDLLLQGFGIKDGLDVVALAVGAKCGADYLAGTPFISHCPKPSNKRRLMSYL